MMTCISVLVISLGFIASAVTIADAEGRGEIQPETVSQDLSISTDEVARHKAIEERIASATKKQGQEKRDKLRFGTLVLGGLTATIDGGLTNKAGSSLENDVPEELDDNEETWGVQVGYESKKIVRDLSLLFLESAWYDESKFFRNWIGDRFTLDSSIRYGQAVESNAANDRKLTKKTTYNVSLKYSIPLGLLFGMPKYE